LFIHSIINGQWSYVQFRVLKNKATAGRRCLMPATQRSGGSRFEASLDNWFTRPYLEKTQHTHKKGAGGVAQGVDPEFKAQHHRKKKKKE
jgi:hypothetical protein